YAYLFVGENLAMNFSSAQAAHNALMQSETHKRNILNQKYADIGMAVLHGELDGKQTNILVQMFGYQEENRKHQPEAGPPRAEKIESRKQAVASGAPSAAVLPANPTIPDEPVEAESASESADVNLEEQIAKQIALVKPIEKQEIKIMPIKKQETKVAAVSKGIYISPNKLIENNKITQVMSFTAEEDEKITLAAKLVRISYYIFIVALAIIAIALLINIFVRISIQHKSVIVQSLLVIIFIASLIYVRLHFLEQVLERVAVL
ncbi:hypothetical protein KAU19_05845, partial [Candidatus Parcubacteria bacterium]|nr:hypothetical protein [Candidatus Parcubacteria bacterium]